MIKAEMLKQSIFVLVVLGMLSTLVFHGIIMHDVNRQKKLEFSFELWKLFQEQKDAVARQDFYSLMSWINAADFEQFIQKEQWLNFFVLGGNVHDKIYAQHFNQVPTHIRDHFIFRDGYSFTIARLAKLRNEIVSLLNILEQIALIYTQPGLHEMIDKSMIENTLWKAVSQYTFCLEKLIVGLDKNIGRRGQSDQESWWVPLRTLLNDPQERKAWEEKGGKTSCVLNRTLGLSLSEQ